MQWSSSSSTFSTSSSLPHHQHLHHHHFNPHESPLSKWLQIPRSREDAPQGHPDQGVLVRPRGLRGDFLIIWLVTLVTLARFAMHSISGCSVCGSPCLSVQLRHGAVWQGELGSYFFSFSLLFLRMGGLCLVNKSLMDSYSIHLAEFTHTICSSNIIPFFATEEPAWHFDFQAEQLYLRSIKIGRQLFGPSYSGLEYDYRGLIQVFNRFGPLNLIVVIELWGLYLLWRQSYKSKNPRLPSNAWNNWNTPTVIFSYFGELHWNR